FDEVLVAIDSRHLVVDRLGRTRGNEAAQRLATFLQVLDLLAVFGRTIERGLRDFLVRDRNAKAAAELAELLVAQLLLLVRDVAAFAGFAQAVTLDRLGQD